MSEKSLKKYIVSKLKDSIELLKSDWAQNYIAKKYNEGKEDPEAQKQIAAADHGMKAIEEKVEFLAKLLKAESK